MANTRRSDRGHVCAGNAVAIPGPLCHYLIMSRNKAVDQIIETFNKKSDFDMLRLWDRNALTFECHEKKEEEKVPRK